MPELVEVEAARQVLERHTLGATVAELALEPRTTLACGTPAALEGHVVTAWRRRGKQLMAEIGPWALLVHLGMTGKWVTDLDRRHVRARLVTSGPTPVAFVDPRRFGWLSVMSLSEGHAALARLGPDAWDEPMTAATLHEALRKRRQPLKSVLMDQSLIAGLGNIAVVDIAFGARVHPHQPANTLGIEDCSAVLAATRRHLERLFDLHGNDEITYLSEGGETPGLIYGHAGDPCPECGATLLGDRLQGRPTVFCPSCQPPR